MIQTLTDMSTSSTIASAPKASSLATKMAKAKGIDISSFKGSGPRGKIMSSDLTAPRQQPAPKASDLPIAKVAAQELKILSPTTKTDRFYIYNFEADMSQLAEISTPIAVQCEKIMGARYCLYDYVVRASIKAFISLMKSPEDIKGFDVTMVTDKGATEIPLPNAAKQTIYHIAQSRHTAGAGESSNSGFSPDLYVCDAGTNIDELNPQIKESPAAGMVILGGTSPKTGIEAGRPVQKLMLPITVYVEISALKEDEASRIAAEFRSLLENPVLLLF